MDGQDTIHDLYGVEAFHFGGIGNLFVSPSGETLHITFWDWHREESGLIRLAIKHATCSPSIVPACSEQAFKAIGAGSSAMERVLLPFKMLVS